MEVTFVRHGQSEANAGLSENPDSPLTETGNRQSQATGARLKSEGFGPDGSCRMFVSPLLRTLMTSAPFHASTKMPSALFPDLCEFFSIRHEEKFGPFSGLPLDQIKAQFPFISVGSEFPCPDPWWPSSPETEDMLCGRAIAVRDSLLARFGKPSDRIVIVSHADPIGRLIEAFLRVAPDPKGPPWTDNCSLSRVNITGPDMPAELVLLNNTSHLESLGISTPA